ncbi:MAG: phospholipase D-like domain-containing protein [Acetobacteraceae bacterium]
MPKVATWVSPDVVEILFLIVQVVVAASVTAHVLLRKRNVRSALGWIGVAWLSPLIGGLLYYLFGVNRVSRRALHLGKLGRAWSQVARHPLPTEEAPNIETLASIGLRVTGHPLTSGNNVTLLHGGDVAYPAMLAAIRDARQSIALASYIFRNDSIGRSFVGALGEAQSRGVAVCVLLDGVGCGYILPAVLRKLTAGRVPVARFLHTWAPWRMPFLNMRNHKKLLIVDGTTGFTGGLNIGAESAARLTSRNRIDDVHARIEGPVVRHLMETFANDWSFTTGEVLDQTIWWPELTPIGPIIARGIASGPDADRGKLETILGAALTQARARVRIVSPYFLPDQRLQFAITETLLRGVAVDIVIPEVSDYRFMSWAMRAHLRFLTEFPVNVYVSPPPFDHAKLMTLDREWCLIGSSNWDTRSLRLNFEFDLECYDWTLTAELDKLIDRKIAQSRRLSREELMAAPTWQQLRDAATRLLLPYL